MKKPAIYPDSTVHGSKKSNRDIRNILNRFKSDAFLSEARSYQIKFSDYLTKNENAATSFFLIMMGLFLYFMPLKEPRPYFVDLLYPLVDDFVFALISVGLIFCFEVILSEKYQIKIPKELLNFIIYFWLSILLYSKISDVSNFNSILFIAEFITLGFWVRATLFYFIMYLGRAIEEIKFNASMMSFLILWLVLFLFSYSYFLFFKIFIFFVVYGIYYFVKEKYLVQSIKTPKGIINYIFSKVTDLSNLISFIFFTIFLLFNYGIFTVSSTQPTLYYFYSTSAQVFAALLGIVVMFSIFILQKVDNCNDEKRKFLKEGLKGFTILYTAVIILSITGILVSETINFNPLEKIPKEFNINIIRDLLNLFIFESTILMVPAALLYLYGMIFDFLYSEPTIESMTGQPMGMNSETLNMVERTESVKALEGNLQG